MGTLLWKGWLLLSYFLSYQRVTFRSHLDRQDLEGKLLTVRYSVCSHECPLLKARWGSFLDLLRRNLSHRHLLACLQLPQQCRPLIGQRAWRFVFSNRNHHRCPHGEVSGNLLPENLQTIQVRKIYFFYFLKKKKYIYIYISKRL